MSDKSLEEIAKSALVWEEFPAEWKTTQERLAKVEDFIQGRRINIPADVTLWEIIHSVPVRVLIWAGGFIVTVFLTGLAIGEKGYISSIFFRERAVASVVTDQSKEPAGPSRPPILTPEPVTEGSDPIQTAIEGLRNKNGVSLIDPIQNELEIERIPGGKFGFVLAGQLSDYVLDRRRLRLFHDKNPFFVELHKVPNGDLVILVFMAHTEAIRVSDPTLSPQNVNAFSVALPNTEPVLIRLSRIQQMSDRSLAGRQGTIMEVRLINPNERIIP